MSPPGDSSLKISPRNELILAPLYIHASGGSPAFMDRWARYSIASHPHSTGTCGRSRPLRPMSSMISPSRPITMESGYIPGESTRISCGTPSTVTSTVTPPSSPSVRSGKRGSWHAERAACSSASASGSTGYG